MGKAFFLIAVVVALAVVAVSARRRSPPDDVLYERNSTCTRQNSGLRARAYQRSETTRCGCIEPNWTRCEVRNPRTTTTASTTEPTTTSTAAPTARK